MKKLFRMAGFSIGFMLAALVGWRDRTWGGDARVFIIAGLLGAEYVAPDGKLTFRFTADKWHPEDAYLVAELNADLGQRYWAIRATDDALVSVINRNRAMLAEWAGNKVMASWLDQEYRIAMSEVKHRYRFHRTRISEDVATLAMAA